MDRTVFRMMMGAAVQPSPIGQIVFTTVGTFPLVVPDGVYLISGVFVQGGTGGANSPASDPTGSPGGRGGALKYINDLPVTPGETLTVTVGDKGAGAPYGATYVPGSPGGDSTLKRGSNILISAINTPVGAGPYGGTVGGNLGGTADSGSGSLGGGGGGAAGYSGPGGNGNTVAPAGGGGSGGSRGQGPGGGTGDGGGGVGLNGQGASGSSLGRGGSGGDNSNGVGTGGKYGGGGGGSGSTIGNGKDGAQGGVRFIWGAGRAFPSTRTADE